MAYLNLRVHLRLGKKCLILPDCMWTVSVLSPGPHPMSSESVSDQTVSSVSMTTGPESWLKVSAIAQHLSLTAL